MPQLKTIWTPALDAYLQENYLTKTNQQLADGLGYTLTVTRNRMTILGLCRMELEYWTDQQLAYLLANYQTTGNLEMAKYLNENLPKKKKWAKWHIAKKLGHLNLSRTQEQVALIVSNTNAFKLNVALMKKQKPAGLKKYKIPELRIELYAANDAEFERKREKIINRNQWYNTGGHPTTKQVAMIKEL